LSSVLAANRRIGRVSVRGGTDQRGGTDTSLEENSMRINSVAATVAAELPPTSGPVAFAQANLAKGTVVTRVCVGGAGADLVTSAKARQQCNVGSFPGARARGHQLMNEVYVVQQPSPDGQMRAHAFVCVKFVLPTDGIGSKWVDCGVMPTPPPPRPCYFP
jgi:hypothetical protein